MTKEELQGIKNEIRSVGEKVSNISGNFWVCVWLLFIYSALERIIERLDMLIKLAK